MLATVAVLYSLWYGDISAALEVKIPVHLADAKAERRQVASALWSRALPLAAASLSVTLAFLPQAIILVREWAGGASDRGVWTAITQYDPVSLSLVVVVGVMALLTGYTAWLVVKLWRLRGQLSPPQ